MNSIEKSVELKFNPDEDFSEVLPPFAEILAELKGLDSEVLF